MRQSRDDPANTVSAEDVQAAVDLLASEHDLGQSLTLSKVALEFAHDLLVGVAFFCGSVGVTIVWTDYRLGFGLFVACFLFLGLLGALLGSLPWRSVEEEADEIKATLASFEVIQEWTTRLHWTRMGILVGGLLWLGGLAWLVWVQAANGEVAILPIIVVALGCLTISVALAWDNLREYQHYVRVERALRRIRERARKTETGKVVISRAERAVLSEAETQQVKRAVDASVKQLPEVLETSYAVSYAPEALDSMNALAEERPEEWLKVAATISSLQENPRPDDARLLEDDPGADAVIPSDHDVRFKVDEPGQRIYVVSVDMESDAKAGHA